MYYTCSLYGCWVHCVFNVCFLGRKCRPGIQKRNSYFTLKDYFKSQGDVQMYMEFYYNMLLFWVLRRSWQGEEGQTVLIEDFLT